MKATLKLTNIGQREGEENWEFNSGVITEIRGRMATGKSRILKSCALALSIPIISEEMKDTAVSFGISKAKGAKTSPLLNHNKDQATIELEYDDEKKKVHLTRDGEEKYNNPGKQKFIYCSMLVENSRIHNYVSNGRADFSWIVTEMSLAKDYETIENIMNSYNELINSKKEELKKKTDEKEENKSLLNQKKKEINEVNNEIKKIQEEIDKIKIAPELKTDYSETGNKLNELNKNQEKSRNQLKECEKSLSDVEGTIKKNDASIEKKSNKIDELAAKKKKLEEIQSIQSINNRIQEILKDNGDLREDRGKLDQKMKDLESDVKRFKNNLTILAQTGEEETLCWTCEDGNISKIKIEGKLKKRQEEKEETKKKWNEINTKINQNDKEHQNLQNDKEKKNSISIIDEEREELSKEIGILGKERDTLLAQVKDLKGEIQMYTGIIDSRSKKIKINEEKFELIEEKLKENEKINPKLKVKNQLTKNLGALEQEIENLEKNISQEDFIDFIGFKLDVSIADSFFRDLSENFSIINSHLTLKIKEQREGAATKFNENIEKVLKELDLPKLDKVYLDIEEDNNLKIIRKGNPKPHELNTLSGGERMVISSLLQISAKETYNPEIPFILGDDLILKMDGEAREIFYNYLKNIAKKYDWFIILTRVTDEDLIKEQI